MKKPSQEELEKMLERELRALPDLPAPETLLHRVMLAVHERARLPWWKRAWPEWPGPVRQLSFALLSIVAVATIAATVWGVSALGSLISPEPAWRWLGENVPYLERVYAFVHSLGNAGVLVYRTAGQQILLVGSLMALGVYVMGIGVTTACYRMAVRRV